MCNVKYIIKFTLAAYTIICLSIKFADFSTHKYVLAKGVHTSIPPSSIPHIHHNDQLYSTSNILFNTKLLTNYNISNSSNINQTNATIDCTKQWIAVNTNWKYCNKYTYLICTNTLNKNLNYSYLNTLDLGAEANDIISTSIAWGFIMALIYTVLGITIVFCISYKTWRNNTKSSSNYRSINSGFYDRVKDKLWMKCISVVGHYGCAGILLPLFTMNYDDCALPKWNMSFKWFMYYWQICCYIFVISLAVIVIISSIGFIYCSYRAILHCICSYLCCCCGHKVENNETVDGCLTKCGIVFAFFLALTIISSTVLGFIITFFDLIGKFFVGLSMTLLTLSYFTDLCHPAC
eukprot:177559_1